MPNLATTSIIVRKNAPCHEKEVDKLPTKSSLKEDKLEHQRSLGVPCEKRERIRSMYRKCVTLIRCLQQVAAVLYVCAI
jgi:hypothetical protein